MNFKELTTERISQYNLGSDVTHTAEEIHEYITHIVQESPSSGNSQTSRVVVVTGDKKQELWDTIAEAQRSILSGGMLDWFNGVYEGAVNGFGTVLFFEDREAVDAMNAGSQTRREYYKEQNAAITEYAVWLGLTELGYGASLQHFNIGYEQGFDKAIKEVLDLPMTWELNAQMPFGNVVEPGERKERMNPAEQVRLIK